MSLQNEIIKAKTLLEKKYVGSSHEKRLAHIYGVADTARILASRYGIDPNRAYLAGLMHDYYRYETIKEMQELLTQEEIKACEECPILYHGFSSAAAYKKYIGSDEDIIEAIKNHTFGKVPMSKLAEIILIADYVEPTRTYPSCILCRRLVMDKNMLYTAIYVSTKNTIDFVLSNNEHVHPYQYDVLNFYKEKMQVELLKIVKEALTKVRAEDIMIYETKEVSPFYDYVVVASINTERQSTAVKGYIEEYIIDTPYNIRSTEGEGTEWYLLDMYQVIVSIFTKQERERVDIDKLYSHLRKVEL